MSPDTTLSGTDPSPRGVGPLRVVARVAAKEMAVFLASPIGWLFIASFAAIALFVVFWGEAFFARNISDARPLFEWMPLLLILLCSALTMRLWSEERRSGTLEHVLVQAAPLWSFVLGKFVGCLALLALALLSTAPLPIVVSLMAELDPGPVIAGYLATLLLGAAYLSIGLFVSSRTDNQIVALIGSIALCGLFWLIGSPLVLGLVAQGTGELLGSLSSGARFEAIIRGVVDLGDLVYYLSLTLVFLTVNVYSLERERWGHGPRSERPRASTARHARWRTATLLVIANALAVNLWVGQLDGARLDATAERRYTLSDATVSLLRGLDEPLLLRAYFSERTHPLLAPLVPQMRDLLREYEVAADGRLRLELVDPRRDPEAEEEANARYGIEPVPFQIADRYESSIVSAYFDVLVQYGDAHETLGFRDLIDVRTRGDSDVDVRLRNPEYDLSRAIRRVVSDFRSEGDIYASLERPLTLRAWVSADERLPADLAAFRGAVAERAGALAADSGGTLAVEFADPDAEGGAAARRLTEEFGLRPMAAGLFSTERFWFHLLLDDGEQLVQLPLDELSVERFESNLELALQRFAGGFTRSVALAVPTPDPAAMRTPGMATGPTFRLLADSLRAEYRIIDEDLGDGRVASEADLLIVAAPEALDDKGRFAIDQFLMRGGSVILATSPYAANMTRQRIDMVPRDSGLQEWLAHHGITIDEALVMDPRNAPFPVPITRNVGGMQLQELRLLDYPWFADIRGEGLVDGSITGDLAQLTMAWASPIVLADPSVDARVNEVLLTSSDGAWLSDSPDVMPRLNAGGEPAWQPTGESAARTLGVSSRGVFESYFAGRTSPLVEQAAAGEGERAEAPGEGRGDEVASDGAAADPAPVDDAGAGDETDAGDGDGPAPIDSLDTVIERSPESARLLVFASNDFLSDQVTETVGAIGGSSYLAPYALIANAVDVALDDSGLAAIRARGAFNRTLPPMSDATRRNWELATYALSALAIALFYGVYRLRRARRERHQLAWLSEDTRSAGGAA